MNAVLIDIFFITVYNKLYIFIYFIQLSALFCDKKSLIDISVTLTYEMMAKPWL